MTDPIADMLTRIRNAVGAKHTRVDMPTSRLKVEIARILQDEGYIQGFKLLEETAPFKTLRVFLKYGPEGEKVIRNIERASRPGRRLYRRASQIKPVLDGLGIAVLSTSRGVMSDRQARTQKVGGELLCTVW